MEKPARFIGTTLIALNILLVVYGFFGVIFLTVYGNIGELKILT